MEQRSRIVCPPGRVDYIESIAIHHAATVTQQFKIIVTSPIWPNNSWESINRTRSQTLAGELSFATPPLAVLDPAVGFAHVGSGILGEYILGAAQLAVRGPSQTAFLTSTFIPPLPRARRKLTVTATGGAGARTSGV